MRRRLIAVGTLLLLALPGPLAAQSYNQPPTNFVPAFREGWVDFGVRGSVLSGDPARYQRFRDLGDGLYLERFRLSRARDRWLLELAADHAGREDQRYRAQYTRFGALKLSFMWDQIPLFLSQDTETLYGVEAPGVLRVSDVIQSSIEAGYATIGDFRDALVGFNLGSRRDVASVDMVATPNTDWNLNFSVKSIKRQGSLPWGATFGFSNAVEVPAPQDTRQTDFSASAEWATHEAMIRFGYDGSLYRNNIHTLIWDNPLSLTDASFPSAYISGIAPSQGRSSLWPDSSAHTVSAAVAYRLPGRSRIVGNVAVGAHLQDGALLPFTINTALPVLPLDRTSVEGKVRTLASTIRFTSRPTRMTSIRGEYRYYDYDNRTPRFNASEVDLVDANPVPVATGGTSVYGFSRQDADVDVTFTPLRYTAVKVGYGRNSTDRTRRLLGRTTTDKLRLGADVTGNQYVTVRGLYEYSARRGSDLDALLYPTVGEQRGLRQYDIGDRRRHQTTLIMTVTPAETFSVNGSVGVGRDDYQNPEFGLLNNNHSIYTAGLDAYPSETVSFGLSYGYENYDARQRSRQASPGAQFDDPSRNWALTADDRVHSVYGNLDMIRLIPSTEVRLSYDFSDSRSDYLYDTVNAGSRTFQQGSIVPTTLGPVEQLPPVTSRLNRAVVDTRYFLTERLALGMVYWFEDYQVQDFALGPGTLDPLDLPSGVLLNYLYRPYTASTYWFRVTYVW